MVTVQEASAIIQAHVQDFGTERIPLDAALGRILREPIKADGELPPFDRVTMDGIAIRYEDFETGNFNLVTKTIFFDFFDVLDSSRTGTALL